MKRHHSTSNPCETSAMRIQCWFGRDRKGILLTDNCISKSQEFCKKYKCNTIKTPRILSQMDHLSLQGHFLSKGKKQTKRRYAPARDQMKPPSVFTEQNFVPENPLCPTRVASCKFREHFFVSKRLKKISRNKTECFKQYKASTIASSTQKEAPKGAFPEECGSFREERHFQLGRVVKYLTD